MPFPSVATRSAKREIPTFARHERNPHLVILLLANGVLLFSALLTRNRSLVFPLALVVCVVVTLWYLYIWNRAARH